VERVTVRYGPVRCRSCHRRIEVGAVTAWSPVTRLSRCMSCVEKTIAELGLAGANTVHTTKNAIDTDDNDGLEDGTRYPRSRKP
jgi:hypothetical protein